MSNPITPPTAIRTFLGYRNAALDVARYREELGRTFMPGTPYMLRPLGLQAYVAAAIDEAIDPEAPHETALICYPSQAVYQRVRNDSLRGRVYTSIHPGAFDMVRSRGAFPVRLGPTTPHDALAVHLRDDAVDWQAGETAVVVVVAQDPAEHGATFRARCRDALTGLGDAGDQIVAIPRDTCMAVWLHGTRAAPDSAAAASHLGATTRVIATVSCARVVCIDDPPTVAITGSSGFNFIFTRHANSALS